MAFRRPRVKVAANIRGASVRRKLKQTNPSASEAINTSDNGDSINESELKLFSNDVTNDDPNVLYKEVKNEFQDYKVEDADSFSKAADNLTTTTISLDVKKSQQSEEFAGLITAETVAEDHCADASYGNQSSSNGEILSEFKRPANVESRSDIFANSLEGNVLQSDLQKATQPFNTSSTKHQCRQRIRPTPAFGQRRNSVIGSTSNDEQSYGDAATHFSKSDRHSTSSSIANTCSSTTVSTRSPQKNATFASSKTNAEQPVETNYSATTDNVISYKNRKTEEHFRTYRQQSRRDFDSRFCNGAPDKSTFKMFDLIYYNPETNPLEYKSDIKMENAIANNDLKSEASADAKSENDNNSTTTAMPVPQLKLNANGELILDDESLVIETSAEQAARKILTNSTVVYHDENTASNNFHKRKKRSREWESSETIKFYRCLQTIGTDFSLMVSLFPNRTRRDLKVKFKKEERINGNLINKALLHPKQFNIDEMQRQIQIDEEERLTQLQQMREQKKVKKIRLKKNKQNKKPKQSAADRVLSGEDIYELEKQEIENPLDGSLPQQYIDDMQSELTSTETNDKELNNLKSSEYEGENELLQLLTEALEDDTNTASVTEEGQSINAVTNCQTVNSSEDVKALAIEEEICGPDRMECDIEEDEIQCILNDLAENSLVLVSTTDPQNPNVTTNEIYKIDQNSGEMYDKPLNIPKNVIQSISSIMSEIA